jgi:hypothetical protein
LKAPVWLKAGTYTKSDWLIVPVDKGIVEILAELQFPALANAIKEYGEKSAPTNCIMAGVPTITWPMLNDVTELLDAGRIIVTDRFAG